jgi:hypothetical protein
LTDNVIPFRPRQTTTLVPAPYTPDVPALFRVYTSTVICLFLVPWLWCLDALRPREEQPIRERRRHR